MIWLLLDGRDGLATHGPVGQYPSTPKEVDLDPLTHVNCFEYLVEVALETDDHLDVLAAGAAQGQILSVSARNRS
jgi:hypothetical protein